MPASKDEARAYAKKVFALLDSEPDKLSDQELSLASKFKTSEDKLFAVRSDIDTIRQQVRQGEARLRSLELQAENEQGRCNGILDVMVDLKFGGVETGEEIPPDAAPPVSKANGKRPPVNRKEKRASTSKARPKKSRTKTNGKAAPAA